MFVAKVIGILTFTTIVQLYDGRPVKYDRMTARRKEVSALDWVSIHLKDPGARDQCDHYGQNFASLSHNYEAVLTFESAKVFFVYSATISF